MNVKFIALGCKVNTYENASIKETFLANGYTNDQDKDADVVVINTCSVTAVADQKSRQIIRRERRKYPDATLVVMGCYSQHNEDYIALNTGADIILGTNYRHEIINLVNEFKNTKKQIVKINHDTRSFKYESLGSFAIPIGTRAYIKIQDGCNNFCSYCNIPYTRGIARSRPKQEIIDEITYLISLGYKEFVLTGIHTAHYGLDIKGTRFSDLVEEILDIPGLYRLRISSIEESEIDDKLINLLTTRDNIASHLHMPLQSGSRTVLKRMRRKYNVDDFINKVNRIREVRPDISITTDVIVGFPGETEEEFQETFDFIKKVKFSELHVFPFSAREGTDAFNYPDQISNKVKEERVAKLIFLSNKLQNEYEFKFIGKELEVILEERNKTNHLVGGFSSNYIKLFGDFPDEMIGKIVKIKVDKFSLNK